jgi:hypothetical protein
MTAGETEAAIDTTSTLEAASVETSTTAGVDYKCGVVIDRWC